MRQIERAPARGLRAATAQGGWMKRGTWHVALLALLCLAGNASAQMELLHESGTALGDGLEPEGELVVSSTQVYGTAPRGLGNDGVVYRMDLDGGNYELIRSFSSADGSTPLGGLTSFGLLFGTTSEGGPNGGGTVFMMSTGGTGYERLHAFTSGSAAGGFFPQGQLLLYITDIYGTTLCGGGGAGTLFRLVNGETHEVLHAFESSLPAEDGWQPVGRPLAHDGWLYGATSLGGPGEYGTLYRIHPDGSGYEQLVCFSLWEPEGRVPGAGVIVVNGWLYGVTEYGGAGNHGTVFRVLPDGTGYQTLHVFDGTDGSRPNRRLTEVGGVLYGVTPEGGQNAKGVLFGLRTNGAGFKVLHHFGGPISYLQTPSSALAHRDGKLYGTARQGTYLGYGGVYRFDPGSAMNPVVTPATSLLLGP